MCTKIWFQFSVVMKHLLFIVSWVMFNTHFFCKNTVYKNIEPHILPTIKNILIAQNVSDLEMFLFCFWRGWKDEKLENFPSTNWYLQDKLDTVRQRRFWWIIYSAWVKTKFFGKKRGELPVPTPPKSAKNNQFNHVWFCF